MGRGTEAIDLLRDGLDRGYRYRGRWLHHERFAALASQRDFSALVERSDAQYERAQTDAGSDLILFIPPDAAGGRLPLLVALHGNNSTMEDTAPSWQSVVRDGWVLMVPQSSEIATVRSRLSVDPSRFVLGGFSMGARLALELGLSDRLPARKILAIATWLPDFQPLADLIEQS